MARGRYSNTPVIDDRQYGTFSLPVQALGYKELNLFEGVRTFDYVLRRGERLDHLAAQYLTDESYWWVLALGNGIACPFASSKMQPGQTVRIPFDVKDVLDKVLG